ncbi:MAG: methylmalonyl Co-A mutase-associated GTPase MeaB [Vicinamibacterales bacterium]|jgi:LAO/AO transport system kinase|nr:methylmalonyl Co-A mutase-associated GTPase MeaB [Vicinamibacterales bacterium]HJO18311.1 methylmalonyl Co-A mutase-associated GTPase MeaB [Vicinamibacterales bacterium]|tara:strand:+ start:4786 stop:5763 length:978 start_codon:yes stop_codon:yes gene_type:complete
MDAESERVLAARVLGGDPRAVSRAISLIEEGVPEGARLVRELFSHTGRAWVVGVTGPPGVGKSTLVDRVAKVFRSGGRRVGIVAVDPTSPFSGGAVLGDRIRMQTHAGDDGVFIRSMATRGRLGGLAQAAREATLVLDAAGHDVVFLETVGVGQAEVDITYAADIAVVMVAPGFGDDVQAIKAGILEIADVFVVNKADHSGAEGTVAQLEAMLSLDEPSHEHWRPPIVKTQATTGDGVNDFVGALDRFREYAGDDLRYQRRYRLEVSELRRLLGEAFWRHVEQLVSPSELDKVTAQLARRELDPYTAVDTIMNRVLAERDADRKP